MTKTTPKTYIGAASWKATVKVSNLGRVEEKVETLNKRARRLKLEEIEMKTHGETFKVYRVYTTTPEDFRDTKKPLPTEAVIRSWDEVEVIITGAAPFLADWEMLAVADVLYDSDTKEAILTVRAAPAHRETGEDFGKSFSEGCDHCGHNRQRNSLFLVRNLKNAEIKTVGSSCLMDFIGLTRSPEKVLHFWAEVGALCDDDDEEGYAGESGGSSKYTGLDEYLTWVATSIRLDGWLPRSKASDNNLPTANAAWRLMYPAKSDKRERVEFSRDDRATALKAIRWAKRMEPSNDYLMTLNTIARAGYFMTSKMDGFAASMVSAYLREMEKLKLAKFSKSVWSGINKSAKTGTIGKRETFKVRLLANPMAIEGFYGTTYLTKFIDLATGALMVTFASHGIEEKRKEAEIEVGDEFEIKATPKGFEVYGEYQQTMLSRVAYGKVIAKAAEALMVK